MDRTPSRGATPGRTRHRHLWCVRPGVAPWDRPCRVHIWVVQLLIVLGASFAGAEYAAGLAQLTFVRTPRRGDESSHGRRPSPRWQAVAGILGLGQQAGRFRPFDTRVLTLAIGGALDGVVAEWISDPGLDLDADAAELETAIRAPGNS